MKESDNNFLLGENTLAFAVPLLNESSRICILFSVAAYTCAPPARRLFTARTLDFRYAWTLAEAGPGEWTPSPSVCAGSGGARFQ